MLEFFVGGCVWGNVGAADSDGSKSLIEDMRRRNWKALSRRSHDTWKMCLLRALKKLESLAVPWNNGFRKAIA